MDFVAGDALTGILQSGILQSWTLQSRILQSRATDFGAGDALTGILQSGIRVHGGRSRPEGENAAKLSVDHLWSLVAFGSLRDQ